MQVLNIDYAASTSSLLFFQSLKETGFTVLHNHSLSVDLINEVYQGWTDFFYGSNKNDYLFDKEKQDGYFPFRSENAKGYKISDLKEFYHVYPWGRIPERVRDSTLKLYVALQQLAAELLQWIENYLPDEILQRLSVPLKSMIENSPQTLLRVLHYPPLHDHHEKEAVRAAPHEDINLITLLPAATAPGLEVQDVHGNWHKVTCDPGNIVVNVGDMLERCTENYLKSTTHRVINPQTENENCSRFSMPLFLHARPEVLISKNLTAREYLHERLREIGVY